MEKTYAYDWLDKLCSYHLNPELVYPGAIGKEEAIHLTAQITMEVERVEQQLKSAFFTIRKGNELSVLVHKYHDMLVVMMNKVLKYRNHVHSMTTGLHQTLVFLLNKLEGLLRFFEQHFSSYMNKGFRVPQLRLIQVKRNLLDKWDALQQEVTGQHGNGGMLNLVHDVLLEFIGRIDQLAFVTVREEQYHISLLDDLVHHCSNDKLLCEMIIYRNLNSKSSTRYFTNKLDMQVNRLGTFEEKLDMLRLDHKALQQLPENPELIYNPNYPGLKEYLCDYIENEILYLEQKMKGFKPLDMPSAELPTFKVMCNLSTDQIAVVLRAADDSRVVAARSLNAVFKAIVPYLSTPKKKDISWQSVRTKSYDTESRDKEIAIAALEEMIKRIRDY
ncbi:MAG: hypothetical protein J0I32_20090 [Sphingobacteriales bacterium]|nr:hypothetical protein [Sphingobacteriales bacterium]OJV98810.1 MAG: hypothetical protein BGO52_08555 [Sphingobacteriales bacterium 44-61]